MKVDGKDIRTIWLDSDERIVKIIDQRKLPHEFMIVDLKTVDDAIKAIKDMYVRGAPLIGATGAYGMYLATLNAPDNPIDPEYLKKEADRLKSARPTAVNLAFDVTPAKFVTGFITERGICKATEEDIRSLFPEK